MSCQSGENSENIPRILAVCSGNPGAITVMAEIKNKFPERLDKVLLTLEQLSIIGSDIWVIYKRHCGHNIESFLDFSFETYQRPEW